MGRCSFCIASCHASRRRALGRVAVENCQVLITAMAIGPASSGSCVLAHWCSPGLVPIVAIAAYQPAVEFALRAFLPGIAPPRRKAGAQANLDQFVHMQILGDDLARGMHD